MKNLTTQPQNVTRYEIIETPNSYLIHASNTVYKPRKAVGIVFSWRSIVAAVFAIVLVAVQSIVGFQSKQTVSLAESPSAVEFPLAAEAVKQTFTSSWEATGFLFPDSDIRYLTDSDIMMFSEIDGWTTASLAQMAINEIYARHHYRFIDEDYHSFFSRYSWYDGYLSMEESAAYVSDIEWANIHYLKNIKNSNM